MLVLLASVAFLLENKKNQQQNIIAREDLGFSPIPVSCLTDWANLAFAFMSETLRSLYSHVLLT